MTRRLMTLLLLFAAQSAWPETPAPTLGRLFTDPATRALLERQRQFNLQETRRLEAGSLRVDGMVVSSSGKNTVWINQQRADQLGVTTTPSPHQPGQVTVITGTDPAADLKVGTTLDRASRETSGGLAGDEIRIKR